MTAPARSLPAPMASSRNSQVEDGVNISELSSQKSPEPRPQLSRRHRALSSALWRAFPEAQSENHLSKLASEALMKEGGEQVTDRGVQKWLSGETLPRARNMAGLALLIGAETAMDILFGKGSR